MCFSHCSMQCLSPSNMFNYYNHFNHLKITAFFFFYFKCHRNRHAILEDVTFLDIKVCVHCDDVAVSVLWITWVGIWFFHLVQLKCFNCLTSLEDCSNEIMEKNTWNFCDEQQSLLSWIVSLVIDLLASGSIG